MINRIKNSNKPGKYYWQMANILDDMGLTVYEFRVYSHLMRISSLTGADVSTRSIAKQCNISVGKVSEAKQGLVEKGLIKIKSVQGNRGKPYHDIELLDIAKENLDHCMNLYFGEQKAQSSPPELVSSPPELISSRDDTPYKNIQEPKTITAGADVSETAASNADDPANWRFEDEPAVLDVANESAGHNSHAAESLQRKREPKPERQASSPSEPSPSPGILTHHEFMNWIRAFSKQIDYGLSGRMAKEILKAYPEVTAEKCERFEKWWKTYDFRGVKGYAPLPTYIKQNWLVAMEWGEPAKQDEAIDITPPGGYVWGYAIYPRNDLAIDLTHRLAAPGAIVNNRGELVDFEGKKWTGKPVDLDEYLAAHPVEEISY